MSCAGPGLNDNVVSNQSTLSRAPITPHPSKIHHCLCRHYALIVGCWCSEKCAKYWHGLQAVELPQAGVAEYLIPLHLPFSLRPSFFSFSSSAWFYYSSILRLLSGCIFLCNCRFIRVIVSIMLIDGKEVLTAEEKRLKEDRERTKYWKVCQTR